MTFDFSNDQFKDILRKKAVSIQKRVLTGIQESDNYRRLMSLLSTFVQKNPITIQFALFLEESEINNLASIDELKQLDLAVFTGSDNNFKLNHKLEIIESTLHEYKSTSEDSKFYEELSEDYCVFLINADGVFPFVNGVNIGEGVFITEKQRREYKKLRGIDEISAVFDEYVRTHLIKRDIYRKFFLSKAGLRSLCLHLTPGANKKEVKAFVESNVHLLNNRPEDLFREDLRLYLNESLADTLLGKEMVLETFKRLDIFVYDSWGYLHFIEVKWVGSSVHANGNATGTEFGHNDINPHAFVQSINYIKELYEAKQNIKRGYLVVFDARKSTTVDTGYDFDVAQHDTSLENYTGLFVKVPDFRVSNIHPY